MEKTIEELADDIIRTIEREDFIYSIKHYGGFVVRTTMKDIVNWWDAV